MDATNNSHTLFIVNAPVGVEMDPDGTPLAEGNTLARLAELLIPGDYEGVMSVTIVESGDVVDVGVSFYITTVGLVDVEAVVAEIAKQLLGGPQPLPALADPQGVPHRGLGGQRRPLVDPPHALRQDVMIAFV